MYKGIREGLRPASKGGTPKKGGGGQTEYESPYDLEFLQIWNNRNGTGGKGAGEMENRGNAQKRERVHVTWG